MIGLVFISTVGGGALTSLRGLAPALAADGHRLVLISTSPADAFGPIAPPPTHHALPRAGQRSLISALAALIHLPKTLRTLRIIRRVARRSPEMTLLPFLTGTAIVTLVATIGLPSRVVVCERNDPSRQRHGWHVALLTRLLYPRAAAITVNSPRPEAVEHLRRISRGRPVNIVPNPRPVGIPRADPATSRTILAVGRLVPQKRHAQLIDAFAQVRTEFPDWKLQIVGEGPLRDDLARRVEELDLSRNCEVVGHVDDPRPFYETAGVFVLPSAYEGTANALLEAAAAGLPSIVTDTTAPPGMPGIIISLAPDDDRPLVDALRTLCSDSARRIDLGDAIHAWSGRPTDRDIIAAWNAVLSTGPGR
jgi:glycosyltransferase involved in cell wall biosynthesis